MSDRITFRPVGRRVGRRGSFAVRVAGEIQSAGLSNSAWLVPRSSTGSEYWKVMPTGCCLGLPRLVLVDEADHVDTATAVE